MPMFSVFCLLPSQSSSGFLPYLLSRGLDISALVCLDFAFHLLSSVISFLWPHLYLALAHVQTISTSSLWGLPPSGTCVPLSRCLHLSHDLVSSFLLPNTSCHKTLPTYEFPRNKTSYRVKTGNELSTVLNAILTSYVCCGHLFKQRPL